jgi:glycosyltransferase involved in cell wall biosynthesis
VAKLPTLLCTVSFPANTGFAWDFIERLYARMADRLASRSIRTLVAYPAVDADPRTLAGSKALPVVLDTTLETWAGRVNMARFVRRENVQVVYFTDRPLWSLSYAVLRMVGVRKIIVHDHASGIRSVPRGLRRALKRFLVNLPGVAADVVVAVSDYVAQRDRVVALLPPAKIRRIWNGLDPTRPAGALPDVRTLLNLSPETVVIGAACRATPEKGVGVLFEAFGRLTAPASTACVLVYIGTGPEIEKLAELRRSLQCRDRIHMLGYLPDAASLLRTADVCVVPSVWQDAFPLAVLEMMAYARPVVAARVGGVPEMIEDGVSGMLVAPNDASALATALERVVSDRALREALGRAARERTSRLFTLDRQISEMLDTFQDAFVV